MFQSESHLPDEELIDAALADAVNQPLDALLCIEEFVEKLGGVDRTRQALEAVNELRKAA
jgi:hypothetical protein